jgi:CRISPR-associated protein Csx3
MSPFPAILVGGPPHSGKSVLVYSLTQALRTRGVVHYALRACPDGEGDWSNEGDRALVRAIRRKGTFNETFNERVAGYLRARHLPLLVDVGGRPTEDQLVIFGSCTAAVLLVGDRRDEPGAYERDRGAWLHLLSVAGLRLLADLRSDLGGVNALEADGPIIRGTLAGLERGQTADGPAFRALVDSLATLFAAAGSGAASYHRATAPVGARFIDLEDRARALGSADERWRPAQLPALLAEIAPGEAVALYGRAPNWVYAATALRAAEVQLFDARYGWMRPPRLPVAGYPAETEEQAGWDSVIEERAGYTSLELLTGSQYLDPDEPEGLPLPVIAPGKKGLVLSGKIPNWLLMAAARRLAGIQPWLAVYQPPLGGAVVVWSATEERAVGDVLPM